jgi:hypothetical protein
VNDRSIKVNLINDSSFIISGNVKILNDTVFYMRKGNEIKGQKFDSEFSQDSTISGKYFEGIPINKVKKLSYYDHGRGLLYGAIALAVPGTFAGLAISSIKGTNEGEPTQYIYEIPIIGALAGGIFGWIVGWDCIYEFSTKGGSSSDGNP